jgi:phosphoribosylformimino-5-aminoimidazole carboxamide ribotide isomerase
MLIWPAIDLLGGRCVRLRQGDYQQAKEYSADPAIVAQQWVDQGAERLHLVDLDAARDGSPKNRPALEAILAAVDVPCQLGGGVRDAETIEELLSLGLHRLIVGTAALKRPDWFAEMCDTHPRRLCVGIDARDGWVATDGWLNVSKTRAVDLAQQLRARSSQIAGLIYTDIARDGMLSGPNLEQLAEIEGATDIPVVASGGVADRADVELLARRGTHACIIGRALYEGTLSLADALQAAQR